MLDQAIASGTWSEDSVRRVSSVLANFYSSAARILTTAEEQLHQLKQELLSSRDDLLNPQTVNPNLIESAVNSGLNFIEDRRELFEERVRSEKIVEGHGDMRPEHICLEQEPVIIDCLEFNKDLRILDPVSELTFLYMECDRLGAPEVGTLILKTYLKLTGDNPAPELMHFYRSYHASVRAKVAIWHLRDHTVHDIQKWTQRAEQYLRMAA
jgi:aminoglycoside phosphotransferase family enzyme